MHNVLRRKQIVALLVLCLLLFVGCVTFKPVLAVSDNQYSFDTTFFGTTYDYSSSPAVTTNHLLWPRGLVRDSTGNFYTLEYWNTCNRIHKISSTGTHVSVWGSNGSANGQFNSPSGIALDSSGNIYVTEVNGHRLQKFNSDGAWQATFSSWGTGSAPDNLSCPDGVAVDSGGYIYVANTGRDNIVKLNPNMTYNTLWSSSNSPNAIYVDSDDNIYVGEQYGNTIRVYNTNGVLQNSFIVSENGIKSITSDSAGNIYIGAGSFL